MGHTFGSSVLAGAALVGLLTAWISARWPRRFAEALGLSIANPGGVNEIRAQYAGVFLAVAAVCGAALLGLVTRRTGFIVLAMVFGGLIFGRLVSLVLNRGAEGYGPAIRALHAIDSLGLALAVAALTGDDSASI